MAQCWKINEFFASFPDDEGNLSNEEKLFVEKNAHLFNDASSSLKPSQSENRKQKNPPLEEASPSLLYKKTKADHSETDEVSGS